MVTITIKAFNRAYLPPPATLSDWLSIWRPKLPGSLWTEPVNNNDQVEIAVTAEPPIPGAVTPVITAVVVDTIIAPQINQFNLENRGVRTIIALVY
ncbi:MAG TPA: hypothetical protein VGX92_07805 [Pyrinomonadaceae bacterium]|jgi:hypothetical protein|nr:hypothetical protein [Pyrinomonadaceae bacterium]